MSSCTFSRASWCWSPMRARRFFVPAIAPASRPAFETAITCRIEPIGTPWFWRLDRAKIEDDDGDYPDIDMRFLKGDGGFVHKDGTPYPRR